MRSSGACRGHATANAHATLARFCPLNAATFSSIAFAKAPNSYASDLLSLANAHAVLARFYVLNAPAFRSASLANNLNSCASDLPAFTNAHAALARPCSLNSPALCPAASASTPNDGASCWPAVASVQAVLMRFYGLKLWTRLAADRASRDPFNTGELSSPPRSTGPATCCSRGHATPPRGSTGTSLAGCLVFVIPTSLAAVYTAVKGS